MGCPYVQLGHGIGSFLAGYFRAVKPLAIGDALAVGRETEYGDSDPCGHCYQTTRHENQGYRGRSSDRVGAEDSLQTQEERTETKAGEYFASAFSPKEGKEEGDESEGGGGTKEEEVESRGYKRKHVLLVALNRLNITVLNVIRYDEMSSTYSRRAPCKPRWSDGTSRIITPSPHWIILTSNTSYGATSKLA